MPPDYWASAYLEALNGSGITSGCSSSQPLFSPEDLVTRDTMAVFLKKGIHGGDYLPPEGTGIFSDALDGNWAEEWIEDLHDEGIAAGCSLSPPLYCPEQDATRAQLGVFLVRTFDLPLL